MLKYMLAFALTIPLPICAISVLVKAAVSCPAATSKDRKACACSFRDDLKKLKSAYDDAVAKHPGWNEVDAVVAYLDTANGKSVIHFAPENLPDGLYQVSFEGRTMQVKKLDGDWLDGRP